MKKQIMREGSHSSDNEGGVATLLTTVEGSQPDKQRGRVFNHTHNERRVTTLLVTREGSQTDKNEEGFVTIHTTREGSHSCDNEGGVATRHTTRESRNQRVRISVYSVVATLVSAKLKFKLDIL